MVNVAGISEAVRKLIALHELYHHWLGDMLDDAATRTLHFASTHRDVLRLIRRALCKIPTSGQSLIYIPPVASTTAITDPCRQPFAELFGLG